MRVERDGRRGMLNRRSALPKIKLTERLKRIVE
jgi:hypothetical protein